MCEQALAADTADDWFFIRYADPDPHLRLRFHGQPDRLAGKLLPEVFAWAGALLSRGLCSRLCLDTYDREVERYGGPAAMSLAESVFGADSRFTVEALRLSRTGVLGVDLATVAVLSIDHLLGSLGASPAERLAWYRERIPARNASGQDYRQRQAALRALLGDPGHLLRQPGGDALARALAARDQQLSRPARRLRELADAGQLTQRPPSCTAATCTCTATGCSVPADAKTRSSAFCSAPGTGSARHHSRPPRRGSCPARRLLTRRPRRSIAWRGRSGGRATVVQSSSAGCVDPA